MGTTSASASQMQENTANQTVQRTGASRSTQRQIERHRRLAPVADLCVRRMHAYDSPEGRANVAAIESKLKELDAVFRQFCSREGYTFRATVDLWPRRRVWRR